MSEGAYGGLSRHGGIETHGNEFSEKSNLVLGGGHSCKGASPKRLSQNPGGRGNRDTILM